MILIALSEKPFCNAGGATLSTRSGGGGFCQLGAFRRTLQMLPLNCSSEYHGINSTSRSLSQKESVGTLLV